MEGNGWMQPKFFSIIVVSLNAGEELKKTIKQPIFWRLQLCKSVKN